MQAQSKRRAIGGNVWRYDGKRGSVWYARIRLADGKRKNHTIGPVWTGRGRPPEGHFTKRTAQTALEAVLTDLRRGVDVFGVAPREDTGTFAAAANAWLDWGENERGWRYSTVVDSTGTVRKWLLPPFGGLQLEEITVSMIERWRAEQLAKGGMGRRTSVKCMQMLSAIFNHAIRTRDLALVNPTVRVPKLRDVGYDPSSFQFYDQTEVAALLRATEDEQDRAIFLTAATSGLRLGELIALRVRDVDFAGEVIRVSRSYGHQGGGVVSPKNGKGRSVPLIPQTAAALARLLQRSNFVSDDDLIFVSPTGGFLDRSALRRRYKHAQAEAHLRPIRFHDLRHSFATAVAASGSVPIRELQELLGHSSLAMTLRYSHFSPKPDAAKRLAGAFAVEEPQPGEPELLAGQASS